MYSKELRNIVMYKHSLGESYRQISVDLNMKINAVKTIITYKLKVHKQKRGPKMKIKKADALNIRRTISKEADKHHKITCNKVLQLTNIDVSRRTLNNWMLMNDMRYRKAAQKIMLSNKHKLERIRLVSQWIGQNIDWNTAIFMDEKRFSLDGPDNWY